MSDQLTTGPKIKHKLVFTMIVDFASDPDLPVPVKREELSRYLRAASKRIVKKTAVMSGDISGDDLGGASWAITT